jgi:DNA-binding NtrC family response regulator
MCGEKLFREDLYFRLSVLSLNIPSLSERAEDIPLLVKYYLGKMQNSNLDIDDSSMALLQRYSWPGNVRELRNVLTYAAVTSGYGMICADHLPPDIFLDMIQGERPTGQSQANPIIPAARSLKAAEKDAIHAALKQFGGNLTRAACLLGMSRTTLYVKLKHYGIDRHPQRQSSNSSG